MRAIFLSTPSARRATTRHVLLLCSTLFLSTPSARRATLFDGGVKIGQMISIHALREEGDAKVVEYLTQKYGISIHALREEGDRLVTQSL